VNDRCGCTHGRQLDLSEAAARRLNLLRVGTAQVRIEFWAIDRFGERTAAGGGLDEVARRGRKLPCSLSHDVLYNEVVDAHEMIDPPHAPSPRMGEA